MIRWLALGDSYTIGEAVPVHERWPMVLAQRLRDDGVAVDEPRIIAVTGWTTDELAQGMDAAGPIPVHDLVTLLIGVNNQYRGRPLEEYREQFSTLLARAITLAGDDAARVVVVSIPDWGVTRFAAGQDRDRAVIARELDDFNAAAAELAAAAGAAFVDITGISRKHPDLVADDGLHPSGEQYRLWAEAIEPAVRKALAP